MSVCMCSDTFKAVHNRVHKGCTKIQKHNHEDKLGTCVIFHKYHSDTPRACLHILRYIMVISTVKKSVFFSLKPVNDDFECIGLFLVK